MKICYMIAQVISDGDKHVKKIDEMCAKKEKELMEI